MPTRQISLGGLAERRLNQLGLTREALRQARWGDRSETMGAHHLRVVGELPDGRRVTMFCSPANEALIIKFHVEDS